MSFGEGSGGEALRGFRLSFPQGWQQYTVDERGRAAMLRDVGDRAMAAGGPELRAQFRRKVIEQFEALRRSRGIAMYVPGEDASTKRRMPMTIVAARWFPEGARAVEEDVRDRAGAGVQRIVLAHGTALRWVQERDEAGTREGVRTRTVSYVYPEPGAAPRRGILLAVSIQHLGTDTTEPATARMVERADAIAQSFRWN